jgi:hypothetical protein
MAGPRTVAQSARGSPPLLRYDLRRVATLTLKTQYARIVVDAAMSEHSKIEWTEATWNPVRGCTKISPGCKHCYAETFAERFRGVPEHPYGDGFDPRLIPDKLLEPLRWGSTTLWEALLLVILVMFIFLQSFRASLRGASLSEWN